MHKAVFLDKDGTLIEDFPYNVDPAKIKFTPGSEAALKLLQEKGYHLIIISNQPGMALGYFTEEEIEGARRALFQMAEEFGVRFSGFYFCPHRPEAGCFCRKPQPGLILRAAREHAIDLGRSWFVGDILNDVEAGRRAGCRTVLIDNGKETEWILSPQRLPHHIVSNMEEAAKVISTLSPSR